MRQLIISILVILFPLVFAAARPFSTFVSTEVGLQTEVIAQEHGGGRGPSEHGGTGTEEEVAQEKHGSRATGEEHGGIPRGVIGTVISIVGYITNTTAFSIAIFLVIAMAILTRLQADEKRLHRVFLKILSTAYSLAVLVFLVFLALALYTHGIDMVKGQFAYDLANHRIHELVYGLLLLTAGVGLTVQLRKPRENIASQLMALIALGAALLAYVLADFRGGQFRVFATFGRLALFAAILHPAVYNFLRSFNVSRVRDLLHSFNISRINRAMLALVIIAAVPLSMYIYTQIGLQAGTIEQVHENGGEKMVEEGNASSTYTSGIDILFKTSVDNEEIHQEHVDQGHFSLMAGISLLIIALGILASFRQKGWRLVAWVTGVLPILLGLTSIVYPNDSGSFGLAWGLAAITLGVVFIAAAEFTRRST